MLNWNEWEYYPFLDRRSDFKNPICRMEIAGPNFKHQYVGFVSCEGDREDARIHLEKADNLSWPVLSNLVEASIDFILEEEEK